MSPVQVGTAIGCFLNFSVVKCSMLQYDESFGNHIKSLIFTKLSTADNLLA